MADSAIITYASKSISFLSYIKVGLFILFLAYILVHSIMLGMEKKDVVVVIKELGKEFLSPIEKAHNVAVKILDRDEGILDYWSFYSSVYLIYLWIKLLLICVGWSPVSNESNKFINLTLAVIFFMFIQMIYLALIGNDINLIWRVWIDIFNAIKFKMVGSELELEPTIIQNISENLTCSVDGICKV